MQSLNSLTTLGNAHQVRNERSHSLDFTEYDQPELTLINTQREMDIDIYTTDQLLGSMDVNTLLDEISTPRAQASGPKLTLLPPVMNYGRLTETSDDSSISDDSDGPTSASSVGTAAPIEENSTLAQKPQSKSRKELIIQQRNLVEELTVRLEELMSPASRLADNQSKEKPLWKLAAIRQLGRRRDAEEENVRLREMLELQVEEAKCLQRILKRRRKIQMMEDMLGMKRKRVGKSLMAPTDNDQFFAKMLREVEDLHANVDANFVSRGFDEIPCPGHKRKADRNVVNGVFYERLEKTAIPFNMHQTQKAVWKVLMDHGIESVKRMKGFSVVVDFHNTQSEETCDTITSSYFAATPGISGVSGAQVRKVVRKYTEEDKIVFVCMVLSEPRGKCATTVIGYHLSSILEIVLRSATSNEDTLHVVSINFSGHRQELGSGSPAKFRQPEQQDISIEMWDKLIFGIASEVENTLIDDELVAKTKSKTTQELVV